MAVEGGRERKKDRKRFKVKVEGDGGRREDDVLVCLADEHHYSDTTTTLAKQVRSDSASTPRAKAKVMKISRDR